MMGEAILEYTVNGRVQGPTGNTDPAMAPHGRYRCVGEDQWINITVGTDDEWEALCNEAGHAEWLRDERFADPLLRWKNRDELDQLLVGWASDKDAWELTGRLQQAGVAATPQVTQKDFEAIPDLPSEGFYHYLDDHPELTQYPGAAPGSTGRACRSGIRHPPSASTLMRSTAPCLTYRPTRSSSSARRAWSRAIGATERRSTTAPGAFGRRSRDSPYQVLTNEGACP